MNNLLEVCCGDIESVDAAARAGAPRIELCSSLDLGGVTPSSALLRYARQVYRGVIHVLVRCRGGNFVYTDAEKRLMLSDIEMCMDYADGFVCGALDDQGRLDVRFAKAVRSLTRGRPLTFHRAIDRCSNHTSAIEALCQLGYDRILTSGLSGTAFYGIDKLKTMLDLADGRIGILPAGGVSSRNAAQILAYTGCTEIHASCRGDGQSSNQYEIQALMAAIGCPQLS